MKSFDDIDDFVADNLATKECSINGCREIASGYAVFNWVSIQQALAWLGREYKAKVYWLPRYVRIFESFDGVYVSMQMCKEHIDEWSYEEYDAYKGLGDVLFGGRDY